MCSSITKLKEYIMKKNIVLLISLCCAISPALPIKHTKTAYELGNESINRLYYLCMGILFGGLSYEFGAYSYKGYSDAHKESDTYIDSAIDGIVKVKDAVFGSQQEVTGIESEFDLEKFFIIPAALVSLSCGFYALTAINKALFYQEYAIQQAQKSLEE